MKQTTGLIAGRLTEELEGAFWSTVDENKKSHLAVALTFLVLLMIMAEPTGLEPATSNDII
jgi:hypothetical protein